DRTGESEVLFEVAGVVPVVENTADAACLVAVRQEEILVAPGAVFLMPIRVIGVAGGLHRRVEQEGVVGLLAALLIDHGGQVGAAAEPAHGGREEAGVHM